MFKKVSPGFVVISVVVLIFSSLTISTASAQEGTPDPNTPVSNIGGVMPMAKSSGATISKPFVGIGRLAPESAQVAGANSTAAPVGGANPESIIGADGRTRITGTKAYPNRAIAYLLVTWADDTQGSCTGWFIGSRTVLTAGHCVFNTPGGTGHGWAKSIVIYPGRNGAVIPFGSTTAHRLFAVTGWTGGAGNPAYDYGVIQTNDPLGDTVGYFGYIQQQSNDFPGTYMVRGYPGDKPLATMWTMSGTVTGVTTNRLWYSMDTFGGQSGSPLYKFSGGQCCFGVGIHTYGTSVAPYFGNSATRIYLSVFNNLTRWKGLPYP